MNCWKFISEVCNCNLCGNNVSKCCDKKSAIVVGTNGSLGGKHASLEGTHVSLGGTHAQLGGTVLYCTVLYCTVLYCTVLYCTVLLLVTKFHYLV